MRIYGRDTIGLVVDFPARELVFFKNSIKQGQCNFPEDVKALYLVTQLDADGDQVELRPAGLSASMRDLRLQDSPRWGGNRKGNHAWQIQTIKDSTNTAGVGGSARAGIGVALVLVESIQTAVSLSSEQVSEILEALTACFFFSGVAKEPPKMLCPNGHQMMMLSGGDRWRCNKCSGSQRGNPRLRCAQCDYDACNACSDGQFPAGEKKNCNGDKVQKGRGGSRAGFTGLDAGQIWYCGKHKVLYVMIFLF